MEYEKNIDDVFQLRITPDLVATVTDDSGISSMVQLTSEEEAKQIITEFEDKSGDAMWAENAVFGKYQELHRFRP